MLYGIFSVEIGNVLLELGVAGCPLKPLACKEIQQLRHCNSGTISVMNIYCQLTLLLIFGTAHQFLYASQKLQLHQSNALFPSQPSSTN